MAPIMSPEAQLSRMEDALRQTQRQLELIDRQITRRMTAILQHWLGARPAIGAGRRPMGGPCLNDIVPTRQA